MRPMLLRILVRMDEDIDMKFERRSRYRKEQIKKSSRKKRQRDTTDEDLDVHTKRTS